ncbi:hypothetical protein [Micromonospora sp. WMMD980]|uniref:hypothetical protein n=1 Tax=Micromonospora sp. WMMD980 TaxID=3016088 RepID=UPI002416F98C|nr:hypothetical protein [Micromonospora sp. WMMD980]MDG4803641.1 hypothetical protein [Micromonospora sp. WMMD980]
MLHPRTRDALTRALLDVETLHERRGWDLLPTLIGLFDRPLAAEAHAVTLDADLFDPSVWHNLTLAGGDASLPPAVVLHSLADIAGSPPARDAMRSRLYRDGRRCIGFALVVEVWAAPIRSGYRHGDLAKAPPSERFETRIVAAVDLDRHRYQIERVRGARAATVDRAQRPPSATAEGRIVAGLDRLVDLARTL